MRHSRGIKHVILLDEAGGVKCLSVLQNCYFTQNFFLKLNFTVRDVNMLKNERKTGISPGKIAPRREFMVFKLIFFSN